MTPNGSNTALLTLLDQVIAERDEATAQLYLLIEQTRRIQGQREQLLAYREEYHARWTAQFRRSAAIEVVHSYQSFVDRLNHAITQLDGQLAHAETMADAARERLVALETRAASVRKLLERRAAELDLALARREQKRTDEAATLALFHGRPAMAVPITP
jgi:flagellar FliJ protein